MGAPADPATIVSSARATALALAESTSAVRCAMVLGGQGLAQELRDVGIETVAPTRFGLEAAPEVVVVGVDFGLRYERLSLAAEAVRRGARFVATNRDPVYPGADELKAGAGSIVAALAVAAGREPDLVVGKPEPTLFRAAAEAAGMPVEAAVVIGDGLETDIRAAHAVGARSVLMLTGVTTHAQLDDDPPRPPPDGGGPRRGGAGGDPRPAGGSRRLTAGQRRLRGGEGVELGQQACPRRLVVVEEGDLQGVTVEAPQLGHRQPQRGPCAGVLLRQRQRADRSVVGREGDRHAGPHDAGQGMVGQGRVEIGLQVAGRAQVEGHAACAELGHECRIVPGRGAVRDAPGLDREGTSDLGRAAPLAGMDGDAQAGLASDGVGARVDGADPGRPPPARPGRSPSRRRRWRRRPPARRPR